jgi:hypothetical protein
MSAPESLPGSQVLSFRDKNEQPTTVTPCTSDRAVKVQTIDEIEHQPTELHTVCVGGTPAPAPAPLLHVTAGAALAEHAHPSLVRPPRHGYEPREVTTLQPPVRRVVPQRGRSRQARGRCNTRVRGSRRSGNGVARATASRGGDSDDSNPGSDPPTRGGARVGRTSRILAEVVA